MAKHISRRSFALGVGAAAVAGKAIAQPQPVGTPPTTLGYSTPSTTGFPAILRGTLDATTYFTKTGGVLGTGQTTLQRQTNATQLQAAITAAINGNKFFELEEGIYEINSSAGLIIVAQTFGGFGFVWRGARGGTYINQFYTGGSGAPVLTIGDPTGATIFAGLDFDGVTLGYGTAVTGLTAAQTLVIGSAAWGRITGIVVGQGGAATPGYDGVYIYNNSSQNFFSMTCMGWQINGAQRTLLNAPNAMGTGNRFDNIYLNNGGSGIFNPVTGYYATFGTAIGTETTFGQLNCEWGAANVLLDIEGAYGMTFECLHIEGIQLTGFNPTVVQTANSRLNIQTMEFDDCQILSANVTGTPKIFRDYTPLGSNVAVTNLNFVTFLATQINTAFTVMSPDVPSTDVGCYSINKMQFQDQTGTGQYANVTIDSHMPVSSTAFLAPERIGNYPGASPDRWLIRVSTTSAPPIPTMVS